MFRLGMDEWGNTFAVGDMGGGNSPPLGKQASNQLGFASPTVTNAYAVNDSANGLLELAALHSQLLVGNNLIATGTGDDKAKQEPTYVVQRPWIEPPDGNVPFDPQTAIALPVVGAGFQTIVSLITPDGYDGSIQAYSWNFTGGGFVDGSGDLIVQVLRNGVPIRNYDNITVQKGTIAQPRTISPLRIYSKDVISLVVNHAANVLLAGNVVGSFVGYFYPSLG